MGAKVVAMIIVVLVSIGGLVEALARLVDALAGLVKALT